MKRNTKRIPQWKADSWQQELGQLGQELRRTRRFEHEHRAALAVRSQIHQASDASVGELVRDLQTAPPSVLANRLPGIGPKRARQIRKARRGKKCFGIQDLRMVVGPRRTHAIVEAARVRSLPRREWNEAV